MREVRFEKLDKTSFQMVLENGLKVIVAPMTKAKEVTLGVSVGKGLFLSETRIGNQEIFLGTASYLQEIIMKYHAKEADVLFSNEVKNTSSIKESYTNYSFTVGHKNYLDYITPLLTLVDKFVVTNDEVENFKSDYLAYSEKENAEINYQVRKNLYNDSPLKKDLFGNISSIKNIHLVSLRKFFNEYYDPSYLTLVITGNVKAEDIEKQVLNYLYTPHVKHEEIKVSKYFEDYLSVPCAEDKSSSKDLTVAIKFNKREDLFNANGDKIFALYETLPNVLFSTNNKSFVKNVPSVEKIVKSEFVEGGEDAFLMVSFKTNDKEASKNEIEKYLSHPSKIISFFNINALKSEVLQAKKDRYVNNPSDYFNDIVKSLANGYFTLSIVESIRSFGFFKFNSFVKTVCSFKRIYIA